MTQTQLIPICFALAAVSGLLGGIYATKRGRSTLGWGFASCIFSVPALICLACLPRLCRSCHRRFEGTGQDCESCAQFAAEQTGHRSRWTGVVALMVALFAFALMVALGSIIDGEYWPVLRGTMVLGAMGLFLGFWGIMLTWHQRKMAANTEPQEVTR